MNIINKPRVLVSTVGSWNSNTGSDTMSSLIAKYGADNVACLYIRADLSDSKAASRYFHLYEGRVFRSIFKRDVVTGEEFRPEEVDNDSKTTDQIVEANRYQFFKKYRSYLFIIARELIWKFGHWKSKELDAFLDDFNPDVLVCPIESYIHFNTINEYIIQKYKPRVIGFLWDDNFTYKQEPHNFWYRIHRFWLRRSVCRMVIKCNTVFALSPKMKQECDVEFGIESKLLTKPIVKKNEFAPYIPSSPIRILYTGKLIIGRDQTMVEVVDAIKIVNKSEQKVILDIYTNTNLSPDMRKRIDVPRCCILHDPVSQSKVFELQKEADVLLFAESLSNKSLTARLSFSTKLTDYFAAGKCVWGVGNEDLGPISYLQTEDAGLVSINKKTIIKVLIDFTSDNSIILTYAKKAFDCGRRNHDSEIIFNRFYDQIFDNKRYKL